MKKILLFLALAIAGALAFAAIKWYDKSKTETPASEKQVENPATQNVVVNSKPSGFNFRFLDEATGIAVVPDVVEVIKKDDHSVMLISKDQITPTGTAQVKLDNGNYDITVKAAGYELMSSHFQLENQTLDVNFNLVPLNPAKELSSAYIQSFHRGDAMVMVGFISDEATGKPLDGVKVYSADKKVETISKANGFFQLILPLPETVAEARGALHFEKTGYAKEVRQNFDMWANGDYIFQIRMKTGSGENKEDVLLKRKANREILN